MSETRTRFDAHKESQQRRSEAIAQGRNRTADGVRLPWHLDRTRKMAVDFGIAQTTEE